MTAQPETVDTLTEAERQRALGEVYAYLLTLAARRRAAQPATDQTPTEASYRYDDIRHAPRA